MLLLKDTQYRAMVTLKEFWGEMSLSDLTKNNCSLPNRLNSFPPSSMVLELSDSESLSSSTIDDGKRYTDEVRLI